MKHKKTNNWVKYVFTPTVAVTSALALLSGVVTPVAQAQTAPHQGSGNRDDGTLVPVNHQWFSTYQANFEWADTRYDLGTPKSETNVTGWPLILNPNVDTAGTSPVKQYDLLKDTGKNFSLELQQPNEIYAFHSVASEKDSGLQFRPDVQDGDGSGISLHAKPGDPKGAISEFTKAYKNCFMADGNDEGIAFEQALGGQILHCKITDENRVVVKVVFNPDPANPGQSLEPVWNPALKLTQARISEQGYRPTFEYRVNTIDGVPASTSGREFGAFDTSFDAGRLGVYKTEKGVEIRRKRDSIVSVNGDAEETAKLGTIGGGVSISGAVSTMEIELIPAVYVYQDPAVRPGGAEISSEDPIAPDISHGFDIEFPSSDLGVAKTGPAVAGLGETISWKVTVTKNGSATGPSHGYVVADELPDFIDLSTVKVAKAEYGHAATANAVDATAATAREIDGKQVLEIKRVASGYSIERRNSQGGGLHTYLTADQGTGTLMSPPVVLGNGEEDVYTITAKVRSDIDPAVIKKHENFVTVSGTDVDYRQANRPGDPNYKGGNSARAVTQIANNAVTYALQSDGDDASRTQKSTDKDGAVAGSP
ncbi:hypothetical protein, partial [Corynebacterium sp. HS2168-gen11]|uniref:hypothetical protein n=1 Tax=Corynebacterium sp. HS2168-gen11 TaxID=2974027 RepID=UPI00216AF4CF